MEFGKDIKKLLGSVRKTVDKYNMIAEGDRIAVGVSGGKDSLALLCALSALRRFYQAKFEVCAIVVDSGLYDAGYCTYEEYTKSLDAIKALCSSLDVKLSIVETSIAEIVFMGKKESNPCSLCAKMRRGALQNTAKDLGCNKLALGHHLDDAVETFMMNLFNEGRIGAFPPVVYFDKSDVTVIRPLVETAEKDITYFVNKASLPVFKNPCPMDKNSERENMKNLLKQLDKTHRGVKDKIYGAMERAGIDGYTE